MRIAVGTDHAGLPLKEIVVAWLEQHLKEYQGTVVSITHDRYFLDNVAEWILELDRGEGIPWKGNYSSWLEQKEARLEQEQKQEAARVKSMKHELEWVRSNPKARQAKSKARLKQFEEEGKLLEAQRLRMRTQYDLEMISEVGYCNGIENYSMHIDGREYGEPPFTLLDYFPDDFLLVIDESHVAVPQLHGQFAGDRSRKDVLVEHVADQVDPW